MLPYATPRPLVESRDYAIRDQAGLATLAAAMKLVTWNVNSIRARQDRLLRWLEAHRPDVVCLQETKVDDGDFPLMPLRMAGYAAVTLGQRSYNGVALLARADLPIEGVVRGLDDAAAAQDPQARMIAATVAGVRVISVYVPNGEAVGSPKFRYKLAWLERLRRHLVERYRPDEPLVICGDFNVAPAPEDVHDPARWDGKVLFHPDERAAFAELARALDLVDVVRRLCPEPRLFTWWDYRALAFNRNLGLRIDHVLATRPLAARAARASVDKEERKGTGASDHAPVIVELAG